jgi:hypothetical protein
VELHGETTASADIDNKIPQMKNGIRSITVLPYVLPFVLLGFAVMFAAHKVNLLPSRANAHNFSPTEMFIGRPISLDRDLGAKHGGKPLAFGSLVEIFDKTDNTVADRTTPALFLGCKSNSWGSAWFYKLDTGTVVTREQWTARPMDAGTITRVNELAARGKALPRKVPIFFQGREVVGHGNEDPSDPPHHWEQPAEKVVEDLGHDAPDMEPADREDQADREIIRAETVPDGDPGYGQLEPEDEFIPAQETSGDRTSGEAGAGDENRGVPVQPRRRGVRKV